VPKWIGPFLVHSNKHGTYTLHDTDGELLYGKHKTKPRRVPISKLKWVSDDAGHLFNAAGDDKPIDQNQERGVVKTILQTDETGTTTKYLVEWKDPSASNQWLPADHFDDPSYVAQYWRKTRPGKQRGQRDTMRVNDPITQPKPSKKRRRSTRKPPSSR
jgi:hypothetical protein